MGSVRSTPLSCVHSLATPQPRGRMASGTISCHRIYNVPPSAHSSSLGPSLAHVEGWAPCTARTATAAEAMVATGGVSRSKLPTTCLLIEDHADLLTEYVNRGVPYHAESALSSAQESSAHAGALLNEHLVMHGLLQPRLHRGGRLGCPPQPFHLANQL